MSDELPYRIVTHRNKLAIAYGNPRVRASLRTTDRGLAEKRAKKFWMALTTPKAPSEKVSDLWPVYIADRRIDGVNVKLLEYRWRKLEPFFGYKIGSEITRADCRAYAKKRFQEGKSSSTVRTELAYLNACLIFKYKKEAPKTWMPAPSKPRERHLTREEVAKVLEHVETPHVRLFLILAFTTGARMAAILEAKWDNVDWDHALIDYNPAGRNKTNKRRGIVPLNTRAMTALSAAREAAQTEFIIEYNDKSIANIRQAIKHAALRSGVPFSAHVTRHTAGVWMAQADLPMEKISQYLAHSSTRVTEEVYARYSPSYMKDASDVLDW